MLSFEEYSVIARRLHNLLTAFVDEDRQIASCGLKPYDFSQSATRLNKIYSDTSQLREELLTHTGQHDGSHAIRITMDYIDRLLWSQYSLYQISLKLAEKAQGKNYGIFAYNKDMKKYKNCEKARIALGPELNRVISQPW